MQTPRLPQSNVASLPPPAAGVISLTPPQDSASIPAPFLTPLPTAPDPTPANPGPLSLVKRAFPGARSAVPAVGPCLQAALQARWKAYREQLRSCQADVSEEAVHELRVAT
ncbi:MAG TPA: hypothetical protein VMU04_15060, partial [Candidatus Acidoferrum sp.]|nr:hypothetical protein [Candidatus Acidoferrum sp.]